MTSEFRRDWGGDEWETFARRLVQMRHGPENVQDVPARVKGDAGIDYFTTNGCCYQCYAPQQSTDTAKATSAMKSKATRDIGKIATNRAAVASILGSISMSRWILLCPFLDDKSVIAHIRAKEELLKEASLSFISPDFRALVQSTRDFEVEVDKLRLRSQGLPLAIREPTPSEVQATPPAIELRIDQKFQRGFPRLDANTRSTRKQAYMRAQLTSANALDQIKREFPDLWEAYRRTIRAEEVRLEATGPRSIGPEQQLTDAQDRLEEQLSSTLPTLERSTITVMATGAMANWLIECPLDFEPLREHE